MKMIGIISDTHGSLDGSIVRFLESCDEIWHAGDIGTGEVADRLESISGLRAVYGNIDGQGLRLRFPERLVFSMEGIKVLMIHIGGTPSRYAPGVTNLIRSEKPDILVTGHSHILRVQYDQKNRLMYINPGAAGKTGFHRKRTAVRFLLDGEGLHDMEILELDRSSAH